MQAERSNHGGGKVEVTGGFLLLLAWLNYVDTQRLLPMTLCAAVLHELGHLAAIRVLGGRVSSLRLSAVGAEMRVEGLQGYRAEFLSALAGPAVNLLFALLLARIGNERAMVLAGIHLALALFNLLPVSTLDGGRCVLALAGLWFREGASDALRGRMDAAATLLLAAAGAAAFFLTGNLTALLVTGWLALRAWKRDLSMGGKTAKIV